MENNHLTTSEEFLLRFWEYIDICIDEEGLFPQPAFMEKEFEDGGIGIVVEAMAVEPKQILEHHVKARYTSDQPYKIVFGLDRQTRDGQGTTLGDVFTIWYWERGMDNWRTGVIEYQHEPRIVKPINWDNNFWNKKMAEEIGKISPILMPWHKEFDSGNEEHIKAFTELVLLDTINRHGDDQEKIEEAKILIAKAIMVAATRKASENIKETTIDPPKRVGAIMSSTETSVKFFGYGNYVGDKVPENDPNGIKGFPFPNPKIILDNGKVVWGCQCWWSDEEEIKNSLEGKEVIMVDIDEEKEKQCS